jgi:SAM-dependent methyltransferase
MRVHTERGLEKRPVVLGREPQMGQPSPLRPAPVPYVGDAEALLETRRAFDNVAAGYARSNAENPLLSAMRERMRSTIVDLVRPGSSLLDLGCGPGCDTAFFAAQGYDVTAVDVSPAMVDEARRRIDDADLHARAVVLRLGIDEIDQLGPVTFDAIYSNFGPLNCVANLERTAVRVAARLRPGGMLVASAIGRVCPWEVAVHVARGRIDRATIRYRRGPVPVPLEGRTVWMQYYSPGHFVRAFESAGLTRIQCRSLGLLAPPPYLESFARRHPALTSALLRLDDVVGRIPLVRGHGDHFLVVMRHG